MGGSGRTRTPLVGGPPAALRHAHTPRGTRGTRGYWGPERATDRRTAPRAPRTTPHHHNGEAGGRRWANGASTTAGGAAEGGQGPAGAPLPQGCPGAARAAGTAALAGSGSGGAAGEASRQRGGSSGGITRGTHPHAGTPQHRFRCCGVPVRSAGQPRGGTFSRPPAPGTPSAPRAPHRIHCAAAAAPWRPATDRSREGMG